MKILNSPWLPFLAGTLLVFIISIEIFTDNPKQATEAAIQKDEWHMPDPDAIPFITNGAQIAYGRQLITHTANYLGPKGTVAHISNGMNCQNCHPKEGGQLYGNCFSIAFASYPKFNSRSGAIETIAGRINSCMERSLNGRRLDTASREMKAIIAYLKWIGGNVLKGEKPKGSGTEKLAYLNRAADPARGAVIYSNKCRSCHGVDGAGVLAPGSASYTYPPLWGPHSYNISAGIYRISNLAGFIKNNMPYGATYKKPRLSIADAWDVAAYIDSRPRDHKIFVNDWPDIAKKPVDYPFGPYADNFTERQHQFGPFTVIAAHKKAKS